ncbi:MAG: hypothetical protein VYA30_08390 [Myxococcota bacterium]|nr:hypothetical protein [Myxococcota bacterium]
MNLAWLLLAIPVWGLEPAITLTELPQRLSVFGRLDGEKWTRQVTDATEILAFECAPDAGCNSHPSSAVFYFHRSKFVSGTMQFSREKGPQGKHLTHYVNRHVSRFGKPIAVGQTVGRYTRYYAHSGMTIAWVQDGDEAQVKIYVDRLNPVGRAEAVALGAQLNLEDYPGAGAYRMGYQALLKEDWSSAVPSFKAASENQKAHPIFREQVQFILAMSIATSLKAEFRQQSKKTPAWLRAAAKKIDYAKTLAPELTSQLNQLLETFRVETTK